MSNLTGASGPQHIEWLARQFYASDRAKVRAFLRAFAAWGESMGVHGSRWFA